MAVVDEHPDTIRDTPRRGRDRLVVEVRYDKVQGSRFRHGTKLIRWREDKAAADCTWRELRPARDPNAPGVEALFG